MFSSSKRITVRLRVEQWFETANQAQAANTRVLLAALYGAVYKLDTCRQATRLNIAAGIHHYRTGLDMHDQVICGVCTTCITAVQCKQLCMTSQLHVMEVHTECPQLLPDREQYAMQH